jgi:hypothetical protein
LCVARLRAAASEAKPDRTLSQAQLRAAVSKGKFHIGKEPASGAGDKTKASVPPLAELQRTCAQNYRTVEEHILNVLIAFQWNIQEADADGVNPTEAEVRKEYARFSREKYPRPGELQRYLADTGERFSDELLRMRMDMIGTRVAQRQFVKMGIDPAQPDPAQERAFLAWFHTAIRQWVSKTSCLKGYIVQNCRQYKGALAPDPRI